MLHIVWKTIAVFSRKRRHNRTSISFSLMHKRIALSVNHEIFPILKILRCAFMYSFSSFGHKFGKLSGLLSLVISPLNALNCQKKLALIAWVYVQGTQRSFRYSILVPTHFEKKQFSYQWDTDLYDAYFHETMNTFTNHWQCCLRTLPKTKHINLNILFYRLISWSRMESPVYCVNVCGSVTSAILFKLNCQMTHDSWLMTH